MAFSRGAVQILTKQQKVFYEENGYILIQNNIPSDLIDELTKRFIDICNKAVDYNVHTVMEDLSLKKKGATGEYLINKLQDFVYDDILSKYLTNKNLLDVVEQFIGPNITVVHSMFINKPPNADDLAVHPLHQDLHYFPFRPADKIIATWTAMERVDESNGCLYVVPGSHRNPLYPHSYPGDGKKKLYHGISDMDNLPKQFVVMEKGDTVFFHPLLLHGSGPNRTQGFRKAISAHCASSDCHYIETKGTVQENISAEIVAVARKKYGLQMTFQDIWMGKSRLVRGQPGSMQIPKSNM